MLCNLLIFNVLVVDKSLLKMNMPFMLNEQPVHHS